MLSTSKIEFVSNNFSPYDYPSILKKDKINDFILKKKMKIFIEDYKINKIFLHH